MGVIVNKCHNRPVANVITRPRLDALCDLVDARRQLPTGAESTNQLEWETWHGHANTAYRVGLATCARQLVAALDLVRRNYERAGYALPETLVPTNAASLTALAMREGDLIGTISLWCDGPGGLQADELYAHELGRLRAGGARLGELGRLAVGANSPPLPRMASLIGKIVKAGCECLRLTDYVVQCHPKHIGFYTRILGLTVIGGRRHNRQVGAPAVLLHISTDQFMRLAGLPSLDSRARSLRATVYPAKYTHAGNQGEAGAVSQTSLQTGAAALPACD